MKLEIKNKLFEHYRTKNIYRVVETLLVENPSTKEWEEGIIYEEFQHLVKEGEYAEVTEPRRFVRTLDRFFSSFSPVYITKKS